ncbi:MAG: HNH endonuclease signature motif containing protein [Bacteroidota bacterium]
MTLENNEFTEFLLQNKFIVKANNKNGEWNHLYMVFEKDNIQVEYFAGWCTIYNKRKRIFPFELCSDRSVSSPKFCYKLIPIKVVCFLKSIPDIVIPPGVIPYSGYRWDTKVSLKLKKQVLERDGHVCKKCGCTEKLSIDHIFPSSKGGPTILENLQVLCKSCNSSKSNKLITC